MKKSYLDLLEATLAGQSDASDAVSVVSKMTGEKSKKVGAQLANMPIDDAIDVIDAAGHHDDAAVHMQMRGEKKVEEGEVVPFRAPAKKAGKYSDFRIGDRVSRGGMKGTIKSLVGTGLERDMFDVAWDDGTSKIASHLRLQREPEEALEEAPMNPAVNPNDMRGQPVPGQPVPGQPVPGQPVPGQQPVQGQPIAGQMGAPQQGQQIAGQPLAGQPAMAGQAAPGAIAGRQATQPQQQTMVAAPAAPQAQQAPAPAAAVLPGQPKPSGTVTRSQGSQGSQGNNQAQVESFSIGDEVKVADHDGVVRLPNGPGDTLGVLIDGDMEMVEKDKVTTIGECVALEEAVLGMTVMPGLKRMQELAGVRGTDPEAKKPWEKDDRQDAEMVDEKPETEEKPEAQSEEPKQGGILAQELAKTNEPQAVEIVPGKPEGEQGIDTNPIAMPDGTEVLNITQTLQPRDEEGNVPELPKDEDPTSDINAALDVIERNMPNLKVSDYKNIRSRMDKISNSIFETLSGRQRKPV